ncbi:hypothetical protein EV363DRAFT_1402330 [Boletus edulis]|nr:hypothetical protein EV363DRAFT_1402330 [Boletus edulis]
MSTSSPSLFPSHAVLNAPSPLQWPTSDEIFHLVPFVILDHHAISSVYYSDTHLDQHIHPLSPPQIQIIQGCRTIFLNLLDSDVQHLVPDLCSPQEAYLLLEAAQADHCILLACKSLAHQIIHRNTLVLQYNRIVLEQAQDDLHAAGRFIGQVHFMIWRCGQSTAFEYVMQEDHSTPTSEHPHQQTYF